MLLIIVLKFHPSVVALPVNAMAPPTIKTLNVTPDVSPKSVVVVSVKLTAEPDHIDIIFPARAFDPDRIVYSNHAPSYEAVGIEYIVVGDVPILAVAVVYNDNAIGLPSCIS